MHCDLLLPLGLDQSSEVPIDISELCVLLFASLYIGSLGCYSTSFIYGRCS